MTSRHVPTATQPGRVVRGASRSSRSLRWTVRSLVIVIAVSVVAGAAAAIIGGPLTDLGSGAGGLFGIPSMLTALISLLLAIPAGIGIAKRTRNSPGWFRAAIVISGGSWIVAVGYFVVAHAIDPCVNGWWDGSSRIGGQPLCERFGAELNWHTRFHLLAHAAPAAVLLAGYLWAIGRWGSPHADLDAPSSRVPVPERPKPPTWSGTAR